MKRAILEVWIGDRANPELKNRLESPTDSEIQNELKALPGGGSNFGTGAQNFEDPLDNGRGIFNRRLSCKIPRILAGRGMGKCP
jgi:hypothetical protein